MKYMLLVYMNEQAMSEPEREHCYADSAQLARDLSATGQYIAANPLHPVATATSIRVRDGNRQVTDGPFAETREQLGGYFLVEARDLDEAIAIAAKIPAARLGTVEIRPVLETAGLPQQPDTADPIFVITRTFDAPRDLVWKSFTEPGRLARWWGPKGVQVEVAKVDLRPGGVFLYSMRSPDGRPAWGKWVYREIVAPERLVTVVSFTDEHENPVRHPLSPTWPLEVLSIMILSEQAGRTTARLSGTPIHATEEERATFAAAHDSMRHGYTATLDKLADYLTEVQSPSLSNTVS